MQLIAEGKQDTETYRFLQSIPISVKMVTILLQIAFPSQLQCNDIGESASRKLFVPVSLLIA